MSDTAATLQAAASAEPTLRSDGSSPPRTALKTAVCQVLAEQGPNPTLFKSAPAADFLCDGRVLRTAPGWWVAFACLLEISSAQSDDFEEVVTLRFSDAEVHGGEPFTWELTAATAHHPWVPSLHA